jgi:hypothetical protein
MTDVWNQANVFLAGDGAIRNDGRELYSGVQTNATAQAVSTVGHNLQIGKYYFEVHVMDPTLPGHANTGVGIDTNPLVNTPDNLMLWSDGKVYNESTVVHTIPMPPTGLNGIVGVAAGGGQIWWRVNSGLWNGSALADPTTGVGGFSISPALLLYISGTAHADGGLSTSDIIDAAASSRAPAGFQPWTLANALLVPSASAGSPNPPRMDTLTMMNSAVAPGSVNAKIPRGVFPKIEPFNERSPC